MDKKQIITKTEHIFNLDMYKFHWRYVEEQIHGFGDIFVDLGIFKRVLFFSFLSGIILMVIRKHLRWKEIRIKL